LWLQKTQQYFLTPHFLTINLQFICPTIYHFYSNVSTTRFGAAFLLRQGYGGQRNAGQQTLHSSRLLFTLQRALCCLADY
ncbi:MAG: hypothetical protein PHO37_18910, partial [Kiritimatiellae bacterium]|nr:hypothetical protein [Kiritimatiellia bacterium]